MFALCPSSSHDGLFVKPQKIIHAVPLMPCRWPSVGEGRETPFKVLGKNVI